MKKFFEVEHLSFAHYKAPLCIKDASFSFGKEDKVLILGVNGSGKTTLLKILSGFDTTYFGKIIVDGKDNKKIDDENRNISLLFSEPVLLNSTILKNLKFLFLTKKEMNVDEEEVLNTLKRFGFDVDLNQKVKNLNLLEKRKFCLKLVSFDAINVNFLSESVFKLS